ncbi:MAG: DUF4363 family protein [Oscillospiraceae bacterium]|nr:DUF4363 family protein [Oscillospiraceae bacterium]
MGRFWFGVGLMILLLALGMYCAQAVTNSHEPIAQLLEQAAMTPQQEDAAQLLKKARQDWDHHWNGMAILSDHGPMDEIDSLFAQAEAYARQGLAEELSALCMRLSQLVRATAENHSPTWWNFL